MKIAAGASADLRLSLTGAPAFAPWGEEGGPMAGIAAAGYSAGQTRYFQAIHREDPLLSCMRGLNTTQAVEIVFEP